MAYLNAGARLVVITGLAALRRHGMVRVHSRRLAVAPGATLPDRASSSHTALLAALRGP